MIYCCLLAVGSAQPQRAGSRKEVWIYDFRITKLINRKTNSSRILFFFLSCICSLSRLLSARFSYRALWCSIRFSTIEARRSCVLADWRWGCWAAPLPLLPSSHFSLLPTSLQLQKPYRSILGLIKQFHFIFLWSLHAEEQLLSLWRRCSFSSSSSCCLWKAQGCSESPWVLCA